MTADSTNLLNTLNYISANPLGPSGVWYRCVVSSPSCCPPPGWFQASTRMTAGGGARTLHNLFFQEDLVWSEKKRLWQDPQATQSLEFSRTPLLPEKKAPAAGSTGHTKLGIFKNASFAGAKKAPAAGPTGHTKLRNLGQRHRRRPRRAWVKKDEINLLVSIYSHDQFTKKRDVNEDLLCL